MSRIAMIVGFALTLLCPVFCLAEPGGCPDQDGPEPRNCEAMAVGAVVARPVLASTPVRLPLPSIGLPGGTDFGSALSGRRLSPSASNRANSKPPPASTRQALLQTFLF